MTNFQDNGNKDTNTPELNNKFIHKNAEDKARKFVERLWELLDKDENIELQHSNQRFELEIIAYEMKRHLGLRDGFEAKKSWLQSELTRISQDIKESKNGLSVWEGGKLTFPKGFQIFLEFIGKAALSYVTVSSISVILSPNDIITLQANDGNEKIGLSPAFWVAVLAGISLVELIAASAYNWFTSETGHHPENDETKDLKWKTNLSLKTNIKNLILRLFIWIRPIHLLLLFIIIVEAFMGSKILFPILQNAGVTGAGKLDKQNSIESNSWDVFLAISVFALVNITFAISKAKRDKAIVGTHNQLYKYLEHSERIKEEIKFCNQEAKNADNKFENYFNKFQKMLDISQQKGLNWINRNTKN